MIQSVRIICSIAVHFGLLLQQMDVATSFLYTDIQELVFVEQQPGSEIKDKNGRELVMQLQKSLYRPAQSPRSRFNTIDRALVEIGVVPIQSDTSTCTIKTVFGSTRSSTTTISFWRVTTLTMWRWRKSS